MCLLACDLSADTPQIRVSIQAKGDNGDDARMVSALSHEFRKLDGVLVTDTDPALKVTCVVIASIMHETHSTSSIPIGYAASVAVTSIDNRLITHLVQTDSTIGRLAHAVAISLDGTLIEQMRRDAQPSSSP